MTAQAPPPRVLRARLRAERRPHTLANRSAAHARFLMVSAPAGFEREFARRAADRAGVAPPQWAMQPIPEVTVVGPRIGERM
jgi:hypothetical protein